MKLSNWCCVVALLIPVTACKKKDEAAPAPASKMAPEADKKPEGDKKPEAAKKPDPTPAPAPAAKVATGDDLAKRYVECYGFFNSKDWKQFETCYTPTATSDFVDSGMPAANGWQEILDKHTKTLTDAMPDAKSELEVTLINGHNGASVALFTGTHTGALKTPMGDVPPTQKKIGLNVAHSIHFADDAGKAADKQTFYEDFGVVMGQLGLSKAPVRAALDKPMGPNEIVVAKDDDTEKRNLDMANKVTDAFNKHDVKALGDLFADDLVWAENGIPKDWNKKEAIASHASLFKGFSDIKLTQANQWAAGDYVVFEGTFAGTNDGNLPDMGIKKTGKAMSLGFLQLYKFNKDGKLTRSWGFWNSAAFAMQLGLVPPPTDGKAPAKK